MAALLVSTATLFFLASILVNFPMTTISDNPCPYPCYPPPTGTGGTTTTTTTPTTPVTTTPSPPSSQTGIYSPPVYPTPSGYYPYNPPPSGSGGYGYGANPPPDPILPYFPYYYKNGARRDKDDSSAIPLTRSSTLIIALTNQLLIRPVKKPLAMQVAGKKLIIITIM